MNKTVAIDIELETGERRRIVVSRDDRSIAGVLAANGIAMNTRCGQQGRCRGCELELRAGAVGGEGGTISAPAWILACRTRIEGAATIRIPARSRAAHGARSIEPFNLAVAHSGDPLFAVTTGGRDMAFAIDIGTSTVDLILVDLGSGEILSRAGAYNAQSRFGDNVISRIEAAHDSAQLTAMQQAVVNETIRPLLLSACEQAGRSVSRVAGGTVAGNTTMLHLLVGEDPTPLGVAPFTPRFIRGKRVRASDIGLAADGLAPQTQIQLLPGITAFIGADILAGAMAAGMANDAEPSMLVDIGTNGEIALQAGGKWTACATAAGPAFEGCGLLCGMAARIDAVDRLELTLQPFQIQVKTIGGIAIEQAVGICGSAYVDFLALARRRGLLHGNGRFKQALWDGIPAEYKRADERGRAVNLRPGGAEPLLIAESDVALLLQAKAAIGAGFEILLETAGIRPSELGRVYLAGGFGQQVSTAHAIEIGLLPGIQEHQMRAIGNSALAGAYRALVDRTVLEKMEHLRERWKVLDLNLADGFEERYVEHLILR